MVDSTGIHRRGNLEVGEVASESRVVRSAHVLADAIRPFGEMLLRWHRTEVAYRLLLVVILAVVDLTNRYLG